MILIDSVNVYLDGVAYPIQSGNYICATMSLYIEYQLIG